MISLEDYPIEGVTPIGLIEEDNDRISLLYRFDTRIELILALIHIDKSNGSLPHKGHSYKLYEVKTGSVVTTTKHHTLILKLEKASDLL